MFVANERKRFDLAGFFRARGEPVALAAITASELLQGCHRANSEERRTKRAAYVERVLSELPVVAFTLAEARHHSRIWSDLARKGLMIGGNDLVIASTAVSLGYSVATLNRREFVRVEGLDVIEESVLLPFRQDW